MAEKKEGRPRGNGATQRVKAAKPSKHYSRETLSGEAVPARTVLATLWSEAQAEERSLLGCCLFTGRVDATIEALEAGNLRDPRHEHIADAMKELYEGGVNVNIATVATQINATGKLAYCGGLVYIAKLTSQHFIPGLEALHAISLAKAWKRHDDAKRAAEVWETALSAREVIV